MSLITFVQIGSTHYHGKSVLFRAVNRAKIPFAVGYACISERDAESREHPICDYHSPATIVMVSERSLKAYAEKYSKAKMRDKVIILFASTMTSRDFNLGMAVGASSVLKPGTYIAARSKVVEWQEYNPTHN